MRGFTRIGALLFAVAWMAAACAGGEGAPEDSNGPGSLPVQDGIEGLEIDTETETEPDTDDEWSGGAPTVDEVCAASAPALGDAALAVVDAQNEFGVALFKEIAARSESGSFALSPVNLHEVWSMLYGGAEGATAAQLRDALALGDLETAELEDGYAELLDALDSEAPGATLALASSVWINEWYEPLMRPEFVATSAEHYGALVQAIDFHDPTAPATMNGWVSDHTGGRIDDLVPDPIPDQELTVLYLLTALFFQSPWSYAFDPADTAPAPFLTGDGGEATVQMMRAELGMSFYQEEAFQVAQLPYENGIYAMSVIVPREGYALEDVAGALEAESLADWTDQAFMAEVSLALPRFQLEFDAIDGSSESFIETLQALGIHSAFDQEGWPAADLTGVADDPMLYVSNAKHKTFVQVTEEGTEAAAASMIEGSTIVDGDADGPPHYDLTVDRPFLFAIHDRCSGAVLFLGQVTDPPPVNE